MLLIFYHILMKFIRPIIITFVLLFFVLPSTFAAISISPLKYEISVEQWTTATKTIKITNEWEDPITLYTSSEDFISGDSTGQPKFIKPEIGWANDISLANWITIKEKNLTLTVWETREIDFDITVPENGEPGWHYWAIFFSPGIIWDWEVAFSQRIWILLLIEVPGEIIIDWKLETFEIWENIEDSFVENNSFDDLPITFNTNFKNNWNIHLKPRWQIELIDEDGNVLKNVWKETITSPTWTFVWEKMVDYIPVNDVEWNVLPHSDRTFISTWEWFGYTVLEEDWTKKVLFKNIEEYYDDKASESQAYLMFWEQIHEREVSKEITANLSLYYKSKDIEQKEFLQTSKFNISYTQKYIWLNYYVVSWVWILVLGLIYFVIMVLPKQKRKKEEEMRKKIMKEMKKKK